MKRKVFLILISLNLIFTLPITACSDSSSEAEDAADAETEAAGSASGEDEGESSITDTLSESSEYSTVLAQCRFSAIFPKLRRERHI